jgi:cell division protein FtsB
MSIGKRRFLYWLAIIISLMLIVNFSKDLFTLLGRKDRIDQAEKRLAEVKQKNQELKIQKNQYQQEEFFESEARDKLLMAKEGEVVVILPEELKDLKDEALIIVKPLQLPVWQQWLEIFMPN